LTNKIKISDLYRDIPGLLSSLFSSHVYPWEILPDIKDYLFSLIASPPHSYMLTENNILIGENVKIHPSAVIEGPCIIGHGSEIRPNAFIRGSVFIGNDCVIGNSSELKNCILLDKVQVPHYNYVGDSILGYCAHMGAGSICSNLKSDGKNIVIHGDVEYETGLRKIGGILGDHADIGCGCVLNPGTVIGKNTSVYPLNALRGVFPEGCIVKKIDDVVKRR
jgi:NDP-sugar pyrophosphorylase family protein